MNRDTLEQLLIDRRMGELPPEVDELLDAYLAVHPDDTTLARDVDATVEQTRRVFTQIASRFRHPDGESGQMPPFPVEKIDRALNAPDDAFWRQSDAPPNGLRRFRPFAVAAAILLAFFLGTRTSPTPFDTAPPSIQLAMLDPASADADSASFWSVDRFVSARSERPTPTRKPLEWTTPLAWPKIGEHQ